MPSQPSTPLTLDAQGLSALTQADTATLKQWGDDHLARGELDTARQCFAELVQRQVADATTTFIYAQLLVDGTHKQEASARDLLLPLIEAQPSLLQNPQNESFIRFIVARCRNVGPIERAAVFGSQLAQLTQQGADYFDLSEMLSMAGMIEQSLDALDRAMQLDPARFATDANSDTLKLGRANATKKTVARRPIGRYPEQQHFYGDLGALIHNFIARDLAREEKFLQPSTRFFTMGSCFARNISRALTQQGYTSHHLEIVEHINTTFANRAFIEWMSGAQASTSSALATRFAELVPPGWDPQSTLDKIKHSDVFILTLGVAPAFFDRVTGEYILPRPSQLSSRVLAEKYIYKTTSVQDNVDNVLQLIGFIRSIAPAIRIVITVSPVPLMASFEFESCVQADCISKSTMRLVAHEVVQNSALQNIYYWPSFEVFRWAGSNASNYFGADDGSSVHVSEDKVSQTIKAFIDTFSAT